MRGGAGGEVVGYLRGSHGIHQVAVTGQVAGVGIVLEGEGPALQAGGNAAAWYGVVITVIIVHS